MKKFLFIILIYLFASSIYTQNEKKVNIAVVEFKLLGQANNDKSLGIGIQEVIMTNLGQNPLIRVIERSRLEDVIKELSLEGSDLFNPQNSVKLGKLLQAKNLIAGSIVKVGNSIRINARIIDVQSGSINQTFLTTASGNNDFFQSLEKISQDIEGALISKAVNDQNTNAPKIEIAFVIDSTGSMNDEIDTVKSKINSIINKTLNANPRPIVKISIVDYKDDEDEYVAKIFPFTRDFSSLRKHINALNAQGGGDYPERIDTALLEALIKLEWSKKGSSKMIFLIGDAPPHHPETLEKIVKLANNKFVSIHTIACSGLDETGVKFFQQLAKQTNASFSYLSYRQEFVSQTGEKQEVITQGREVFIQRSNRSPQQNADEGEGRVAPMNTARDKDFRRQWGDIAAGGRNEIERRRQEYNVERAESDDESLSVTRNRNERQESAISSENVNIRGFRRTGEMENNLDSILIQNIQKQAARDLNINYSSLQNLKIIGSANVINDNQKIWVFFTDKKEFEKIQNKTGNNFWISGSIHKNKNNFIIMDVKISPTLIPQLGKKAFNEIFKNIDFYVKNGITNEKRWFFNVKILNTKKIDN